MAQDQHAEYIGNLMAIVMPMREELHTTRGLTEVIALRVARLDSEKELPLDQLSRIRKDIRALKEARTTNPERQVSSPDHLTTGQRDAIDREEAEKIIAAANAKRDQENEIRILREQVALFAKRDAAASESKTFWARNGLTIMLTGIVSLSVSLTGIYVAYRLTKPDVSQTLEYTQPKGSPSGK